jgi:hypothetical protein
VSHLRALRMACVLACLRDEFVGSFKRNASEYFSIEKYYSEMRHS